MQLRAFSPHGPAAGPAVWEHSEQSPAALLLSWDTRPEPGPATGAPGLGPGTVGTAAPPGHCCCALPGETSQPHKSHRTWLLPSRHCQRTHPSNGGDVNNRASSTKLSRQVELQFVVQNLIMVYVGGHLWKAQSDFFINFGAFCEIATDTLYPIQPKTANICMN